MRIWILVLTCQAKCKAKIIRDYDGKDIVLNEEKNCNESSDFPDLKDYIGKTNHYRWHYFTWSR